MASSGAEGNGATAPRRNRSRVLVVDGCDCWSPYFRAQLDAFGAEIEYVTTGAEATELIFRGKTYHLIVVDAAMPDSSGAKVPVTRQLRSMGVQTKIDGVTPASSEPVKRAFMEAGADYYSHKLYIFRGEFIPIMAGIGIDP